MFKVSQNFFAFCTAMVLVPSIGAAQSACPTADMLNGNGITFTQDNGDSETHQLAANGSILQRMNYDGVYSVNYLVHGVHVLQLSDEEDGRILPDSIWLFDFGMPISDLPVPVAGGRWSVTTTQTYAGAIERETVSHNWGGMTSYTIGNCTLDAIPITIKYSSADYDHTEEVMYFPDLETAILTAYVTSDERDEFTFVDVRGN